MRLILENSIERFSYTGGYKQGRRNGKGEFEWADGSRKIAYRVVENNIMHFCVQMNIEFHFLII